MEEPASPSHVSYQSQILGTLANTVAHTLGTIAQLAKQARAVLQLTCPTGNSDGWQPGLEELHCHLVDCGVKREAAGDHLHAVEGL